MIIELTRAVLMGLVFIFIVLITVDSGINVYNDIKEWMKGKKK